MKLLYALQSTGGSPEIRKHLFDVLDLLGIRHKRGVFTAKAFAYTVGRCLKTSKSPELHLLFDSLEDVMGAPRLTEYLHSHVLSLLNEIGGDGPISSALITPVVISRDRRDRRRSDVDVDVIVLLFMVGILTVVFGATSYNAYRREVTRGEVTRGAVTRGAITRKCYKTNL